MSLVRVLFQLSVFGFRFLQQTCRNQGLEKRGYKEWLSKAMALRIHLHVKLEGKTKTGAT